MSHFKDVPKEPSAAFNHVLALLLESAGAFPQKGDLNPKIKTKAITYIRMLQAIYPRLPNREDYEAPLDELLGIVKGPNPSVALSRLNAIEVLFLANSFQNHFIDDEDEASFNRLDWHDDDRNQVLETLTNARNLIFHSVDFEDTHKKRVLFWISKAETEVFRKKGTFATVMAAAGEILDLAEEAGEKGKPLAKLIQMVRTTTKRSVNIIQIEAADEPKQITDKSTPDDE